MLKSVFITLIFVSQLTQAAQNNPNVLDQLDCKASVAGKTVELYTGAYMTYPASFYLDGNYTVYDEQQNFKSQLNVFIRETEDGVISAFFTQFLGKNDERINLGRSQFTIQQGIKTWIGIPGTGTSENPQELELICHQK